MKKATVTADTAEKHSRHFASLSAWWYFYTRAVFPGDADTTCGAAGTRSVCVFEACKHLLHTLSGRSSRAQQGVVSTAPLEKIRWRVVDLYILCSCIFVAFGEKWEGGGASGTDGIFILKVLLQ